MTHFLDGPAAGVALSLRRAPWLLRVVRSAAGEWDALDQVEDYPRTDESITVYYRCTTPTHVHVDYSDRGRRRGETQEWADYRVLPEQPDDFTMASTDDWRRWCDGPGRDALRHTLEVVS